MKGLLTQTPHTDEPVVGDVLENFPYVVMHAHEIDHDGMEFWLGLTLHSDHIYLSIEDDEDYLDIALTAEQAKALHESLGVALYGN